MAETPSEMIPLGTRAPTFNLLDVRTQQWVALDAVKSNIATVIIFLCNHCPYVKHIQTKLVEIIQIYQKQNISFIGISSNDANAYPVDAPDKMKIEAELHHYTFPYLYDATQEVAKAYHAACTPDFYIFDEQLGCVYRGRFDDSIPSSRNPVTGKDLTQALDSLLAKKSIDPNQIPSLGCSIKWKKN